MVDENTRKKEETVEQTRLLLEQAEIQAQAERERRDEIIRQIRALESVPADRTKVLTVCRGHHAAEA